MIAFFRHALRGCQATATCSAAALALLAGCATQAPPPALPPPPVVAAPVPRPHDVLVPSVTTPTVIATPPPVAIVAPPVIAEPPPVVVVPPPVISKRGWSPAKYAAYYGAWQDAQVRLARDFDLVAFHPGDELENITKAQVQAVRRPDADGVGKTRMCAYITIGEDDSPLAPPNASDDRHGPVRWENGKLFYTEKGYPARYVDDKDKNGKPDENGEWHSRYCYIGDPVWQNMLLARMHQIDETVGPVDGFFLDTVDTVSEPAYSYMQGPMLDFLAKVRAAFPRAYLISNRGMCLIEYDAARFRRAINAVMFENLVTEWDDEHKAGIVSPDLADNAAYLKKIVGPQVRRADGFDLLVLDYADPAQLEYPYLMHLQREVLGDVPHSRYLSNIELDVFFPAPANFAPPPDKALPRVLSAKLGRDANRTLVAELAVDGMGDWKLNQELLVEVVFIKTGADVLTGTRVVPAPEQVAYDAASDRVQVKLTVPKGAKAGQVLVRFITAKAALQTPWQRLALPQ